MEQIEKKWICTLTHKGSCANDSYIFVSVSSAGVYVAAEWVSLGIWSVVAGEHLELLLSCQSSQLFGLACHEFLQNCQVFMWETRNAQRAGNVVCDDAHMLQMVFKGFHSTFRGYDMLIYLYSEFHLYVYEQVLWHMHVCECGLESIGLAQFLVQERWWDNERKRWVELEDWALLCRVFAAI